VDSPELHSREIQQDAEPLRHPYQTHQSRLRNATPDIPLIIADNKSHDGTLTCGVNKKDHDEKWSDQQMCRSTIHEPTETTPPTQPISKAILFLPITAGILYLPAIYAILLGNIQSWSICISPVDTHIMPNAQHIDDLPNDHTLLFPAHTLRSMPTAIHPVYNQAPIIPHMITTVSEQHNLMSDSNVNDLASINFLSLLYHTSDRFDLSPIESSAISIHQRLDDTSVCPPNALSVTEAHNTFCLPDSDPIEPYVCTTTLTFHTLFSVTN
jgi:hypothetical protein